MKRRHVTLSLAPFAALLAAAAGCGGNSCQDAVKASQACFAKLNASSSFDVAACSALSCRNEQGFLDCVVAAPCTEVAQYNQATFACATSNGCAGPQ